MDNFRDPTLIPMSLSTCPESTKFDTHICANSDINFSFFSNVMYEYVDPMYGVSRHYT